MFYTQLGTDKVTVSQLEEMTTAINEQMSKDFCPTYSMTPLKWSVLPQGGKAKPGDLVITLMDEDKTEPGALGYHSEMNNGVKFGSILVDPCLKYLGANPLVSVGQCLSHECCEAAADVACDVWVLGTDNQLWAQETCDPVESSTYTIGSVTVSNFVTPTFFDDQAPAQSRFDHLGALGGAFKVDKGGYAVLWKPGSAKPHQLYGEEYPEWRKATKQREFSRTKKRLRA
jgi:hypothetical protein